jgi:hypothetical protein
MSPEAIMHNDVAVARKTKSHDHAEIANHIAPKDGVKHEKTHSNSVASKKNEITLKGGCLLSTKSEASELLASNSIFYALISLYDMQQSLPPIVANILQEYADIFPCKVPAGLPPLRGIEHQIHLIPGASLLNRAPYRTNPEETNEIQRQVQELLDKGYVCESLSPCVVPVILVPKKDDSWHMRVDCRAINNITIRYCHPIPRLDLALATSDGDALLAKLPISSFQNPNLIVFPASKLHIHLTTQCLFYLFLLLVACLSAACVPASVIQHVSLIFCASCALPCECPRVHLSFDLLLASPCVTSIKSQDSCKPCSSCPVFHNQRAQPFFGCNTCILHKMHEKQLFSANIRNALSLTTYSLLR